MRTDNITLLLLVANLVFSIYAFQTPGILDKYKFNVGAVLHRKEYHRILTSGFLHANFVHLFVNLLSLYFCGPVVYAFFATIFGPFAGGVAYLVTYFASMVVGDLLALVTKKNNLSYSAVGASGAISGLIFAFVYFVPEAEIRLFFLIPCPAWLFAILFVGYSLFGIRTGHGRWAHEGHLGGAILGMLIAVALVPSLLQSNWWIVAVLVIPTATFLYLTIARPDISNQIMQGRFNFQRQRRGPRVVVRDPRGQQKAKKPKPNQTPQEEMDDLLDRVARKGYDGLTREEKLRLDELSGRLREKNSRNDNT